MLVADDFGGCLAITAVVNSKIIVATASAGGAAAAARPAACTVAGVLRGMPPSDREDESERDNPTSRAAPFLAEPCWRDRQGGGGRVELGRLYELEEQIADPGTQEERRKKERARRSGSEDYTKSFSASPLLLRR